MHKLATKKEIPIRVNKTAKVIKVPFQHFEKKNINSIEERLRNKTNS